MIKSDRSLRTAEFKQQILTILAENKATCKQIAVSCNETSNVIRRVLGELKYLELIELTSNSNKGIPAVWSITNHGTKHLQELTKCAQL